MRFSAVGLLVTLALGLILAPLAAETQPPAKVPRIGVLWLGASSDKPRLIDAFRQGLRDLGYVEGQNLVIEDSNAEGGQSGSLPLRPSSSGSRWT